MLNKLLWAFDEGKYTSKEEFSNAMKQYQVEMNGEDIWKPDEIVIDKLEMDILLEMNWNEPPNDSVEFTLKSENNNNFTALDLMFQLHNFIAQYDLGDHYFFEGLSQDLESNRYIIHTGS